LLGCCPFHFGDVFAVPTRTTVLTAVLTFSTSNYGADVFRYMDTNANKCEQMRTNANKCEQMRTNANKCEQMRTTHGSRPDIDGVDVWDMLVNPAAYTLTSAHETLVLSHEVMLKGNLKIMTSQRGDTRQGFDPFENTWQHRDGSWCAHVLCFAVVDSLGRFHCWSRLIVSIDSCAWSNPQLNASLTMGVVNHVATHVTQRDTTRSNACGCVCR
jgi:hypothetical protein